MTVWLWVLKFFVFLVVFRLVQIGIWNFRRVFYVHPLVTDLLVTILAVVVLATLSGTGWFALLSIAILLGIIRGDQEHGETTPRRQLM
ncbi:hypothetical protein [Tumebacillus permanentifrigoris]|uniref:Uncharacterized protein n=1 Tax=Tumebacillus permanentifrigoris TaxID=378543 RepID=A0A316D3Q7_9BACL|nr:hypothetical protein [Tumebacillus permanentifrigoris]PWK05719.1 hypothetical protein C7459_12286 [Tumebacillus permanentifrigoris]